MTRPFSLTAAEISQYYNKSMRKSTSEHTGSLKWMGYSREVLVGTGITNLDSSRV